MNVPKTEIGMRIRLARKRLGYSQESLAQRAGVSYGTIRRVEAGDVKTTINNLLAIWDALEVDDLFDGLDDDFVRELKKRRSETGIKNMFADEEIKILKMKAYRPVLNEMIEEIWIPDHFFAVYEMVKIINEYEKNFSKAVQNVVDKSYDEAHREYKSRSEDHATDEENAE